MKRGAFIIALVLASGGIARAQRTGMNEAFADAERCRQLFEDGKYEQAEKLCTVALRRDASYVEAWKIYLPTLIALHKEDKAIAEAERAETVLGITDARVLTFHGVAILQAASRPAVDPKTQQPNKWAKQYSRALPYLERAVTLNSDELSAQAALCTYWTLEPKYMDRSEAACHAALRKIPNNVDWLDSQAWIYYNHKRYAEAQTTGEQVLRLKPTAQMELKAKIVIGLSQAGRGDCVNARRTLEPLQKLAPKNPTIERGLSQCTPAEAK